MTCKCNCGEALVTRKEMEDVLEKQREWFKGGYRREVLSPAFVRKFTKKLDDYAASAFEHRSDMRPDAR